MKKIYLLIFVFVLFSAVPSFSMKIITNNETDRIVPSRSSIFEAEYYTDGNYMQNQNIQRNVIPGYQGSRFEDIFRRLLGENIRTELKGKTWHYPAYYYRQPKNNQSPETVERKINENIAGAVNSKPYIREAADYYFIDTIVNPDTRIPVGIE